MNIKNKLLAALLISVFLLSVSSVVAEDVADVDELAIDNADETIAVNEDSDEPLAADENTETLTAEEDEEPSSNDATDVDIKVVVLDKNPKVGDKIRVKLILTNLGSNDAQNVEAQFSFTDIYKNLDASFKLIDSDHSVDEVDGGYIIKLDSLAGSSTEEIILTFLVTTSGSKTVDASVFADNAMEVYYANDTFTVSEGSSGNNDQSSASKTMHATGNPLALLAMALFCIVPYYRRK
ncbi:hypothetical protein [Methanobrevibacter sp.]|uniref:hypothetical protein n=1 Tax=Methanobrevibacter sp. TaxID=66852 RepID=UPI0025F4465F|nr:hypothetical protein [Methanobrevibacter sp.]MBQ2666140.1 hypothetical protein [Methanobrevibacter sp.]